MISSTYLNWLESLHLIIYTGIEMWISEKALGNQEINRNFVGSLLNCYTTKHFIQHNIHIDRVIMPTIQEKLRHDVVADASRRGNNYAPDAVTATSRRNFRSILPIIK